jgi:hypothetical protein
MRWNELSKILFWIVAAAILAAALEAFPKLFPALLIVGAGILVVRLFRGTTANKTPDWNRAFYRGLTPKRAAGIALALFVAGFLCAMAAAFLVKKGAELLFLIAVAPAVAMMLLAAILFGLSRYFSAGDHEIR